MSSCLIRAKIAENRTKSTSSSLPILGMEFVIRYEMDGCWLGSPLDPKALLDVPPLEIGGRLLQRVGEMNGSLVHVDVERVRRPIVLKPFFESHTGI